MSKPNIFGATGLTGGVVNRDLDSIDGNAEGMVDGAAAVVITDSGTYHYHLNESSGAVENSPYVIKPDTNAGNKRWLLVSQVGPMSHVYATSDNGQTLSNNTNTVLIYEDEVYDTLSEYNPTTGKFTATYTGYYHVAGSITLDSNAFTHLQQLGMTISKNGTNVRMGGKVYGNTSDASIQLALSCSTVIYLSATDYIEIIGFQNSGDTIALRSDGWTNWLTIDRIA